MSAGRLCDLRVLATEWVLHERIDEFHVDATGRRIDERQRDATGRRIPFKRRTPSRHQPGAITHDTQSGDPVERPIPVFFEFS